jgi:hypothetical protein
MGIPSRPPRTSGPPPPPVDTLPSLALRTWSARPGVCPTGRYTIAYVRPKMSYVHSTMLPTPVVDELQANVMRDILGILRAHGCRVLGPIEPVAVEGLRLDRVKVRALSRDWLARPETQSLTTYTEGPVSFLLFPSIILKAISHDDRARRSEYGVVQGAGTLDVKVQVELALQEVTPKGLLSYPGFAAPAPQALKVDIPWTMAKAPGAHAAIVMLQDTRVDAVIRTLHGLYPVLMSQVDVALSTRTPHIAERAALWGGPATLRREFIKEAISPFMVLLSAVGLMEHLGQRGVGGALSAVSQAAHSDNTLYKAHGSGHMDQVGEPLLVSRPTITLTVAPGLQLNREAMDHTTEVEGAVLEHLLLAHNVACDDQDGRLVPRGIREGTIHVALTVSAAVATSGVTYTASLALVGMTADGTTRWDDQATETQTVASADVPPGVVVDGVVTNVPVSVLTKLLVRQERMVTAARLEQIGTPKKVFMPPAPPPPSLPVIQMPGIQGGTQ